MGDITPRQLLNLFQVVGAITNSDQILLHSAEGNTTTKITAELFRAYLNKGFEISVSDDGFLMIGGSKTQSKVEGITPILRRGTDGIEYSKDKGQAWETVAKFTDLGVILGPFTQEEYDKLREKGLIQSDCYYSIWEDE
mgnify:FL=1